jgi:hypothetical protein
MQTNKRDLAHQQIETMRKCGKIGELRAEKQQQMLGEDLEQDSQSF